MATWKEVQKFFEYENGDVKAYALTLGEIKALDADEKVTIKNLVSEVIDPKSE
jgi:hypothetical protein